MNIEPRTEGCTLLLDLIQRVKEGQELSKTDIEETMDHPDMQRWFKAYDWIEGARDKVERLIQSLDKGSPEDLNKWEERIDHGLRRCLDDLDQMRENVKDIEEIDWGSAVKESLRYLPDGTELEPGFIVTVDGFNGGMFRYNTVYLSIVYFDRSRFNIDTFAHEFHHMGAEYWFEKNRLIERYEQRSEDEKNYLTMLVKYLVSEGMANAFCSPAAITKSSGDSDRAEKFNERIRHYEENMDELFNRLEDLLERILDGSFKDLSELYNGFTMDFTGVGLPPGHFLSGRMTLAMRDSQSVEEEEIIDLVKDPFRFFELYNRAADELNRRKISPELVEKLNDLTDDLREG